ncbi:MAG: hypothetical protein WCJ58_00760 [bacterium]
MNKKIKLISISGIILTACVTSLFFGFLALVGYSFCNDGYCEEGYERYFIMVEMIIAFTAALIGLVLSYYLGKLIFKK